ncbi:DUF169 domain-containing protein [Dethiosulfatarculus sandiegensis]|uniref:Uncharacterized protein n=1 Tax=Dethiosulfatarculus sandiegensis TaxID=1429043 RepID=A0A0D2JCY1_9BACT|nr:DUF169 domain-containing protein [Dethiosulfatarculus sandiegensis]KIX13616.1 hypothetical protein X474_11365 [Dethiosulfatarculus sandiegensis]
MADSKIVKESLARFLKATSFNYPATAWYFSAEGIEDSFVFTKDKWVCMFMYFKMVIKKGRRIRFSGDYAKACTGPAEYFGFRDIVDDGGSFIAETERFKKTCKLAYAYYKESLQSVHPAKEKYLYLERIEDLDPQREVEVVNLFPDPVSLADLAVLSNYDRAQNLDNVMVPFASGCQSLFAFPYNEKFRENPKSVMGLMDPLARNFTPRDMLAFSVPADRFVEMAQNIKGSFLDK